MEQFKRAQVIMLSTNVLSNLSLSDKLNNLVYNNDKHDTLSMFTNQHLYIISDDEIKEGDWFIEEGCELPINAGYNIGLCEDCKKIIATTDTSLELKCDGKCAKYECVCLYPQPSKQFIEKYIESYNKGKVITDVLVEYELYMQRQSNIGTTKYIVSKDNKSFDKLNFDRIPTLLGLKINPKDNTITIKKVKDSWNREEVIRLCSKAFLIKSNNDTIIEDFDKWIEINL
jgi:hypothetical protein